MASQNTAIKINAPGPSPIRAPQVTRATIPAKAAGRERHLEVVIGPEEIRTLLQLIDYDGLNKTADNMGVADVTVLRVCAGLFHTCRPETRHRIRSFFAK